MFWLYYAIFNKLNPALKYFYHLIDLILIIYSIQIVSILINHFYILDLLYLFPLDYLANILILTKILNFSNFMNFRIFPNPPYDHLTTNSINWKSNSI